TLTLASPPPSVTCPFWVQNFAATTLTIARNGMTINGGTSNITLPNQYSSVRMWTDSTGANYLADLPMIAGTNITLTPGVNGMTIAATSAGYTTVRDAKADNTGTSLTARTTVNGRSGIKAVDDAGNTRTDIGNYLLADGLFL